MQEITRWDQKKIQMYDRGDRVEIGGGELATVEHDMGGDVVHVHPDGSRGQYPHNAVPVERGGVKLTRQTEDGEQVQIEIYSGGSTHTLYECCGYDNCRELILVKGLGIDRDEAFAGDRFLTEVEGEPVRITVKPLDDPSSCIWCFGCGDFLAHGEGCECEDRGYNPEADREPMRPLVVENGRLELTHFN